jgi:hypothetical protein
LTDFSFFEANTSSFFFDQSLNLSLAPATIIHNIMILQPELNQDQADNHYGCTCIKKHCNRLKKGRGSNDIIKAQLIYCHSAILVAQIA